MNSPQKKTVTLTRCDASSSTSRYCSWFWVHCSSSNRFCSRIRQVDGSAWAALILLLALGWLFWRPLDNFRRIVTTEGQDIREVITAIKDLRAAYFAAEIILIVFAAGIIVEVMRLTTGKGL